MKTIILSLTFLIATVAHAEVTTSRNYADAVKFIENLATQYPQNAEIFTLGYSSSGVAIQGIKIGKGPVNNLVVAAHHGNEYGSAELALHFAESVAKEPIAGQTMHVIPVLNIDGYNNRQRWERVNGKLIDPNRDYPGPCGTEGPFNSRGTKALADFIAANNIVAAATLHTYWPAAVFPWGLSSHDLETPYTPIFMNMVQAATQFSDYQMGNASEVIYPADGTFEDFAFWKHGVWSILFEVGHSHNPSVNGIHDMLKGNIPGLRKMFEVAPKEKATNHEFTGRCDAFLRTLDMHIE